MDFQVLPKPGMPERFKDPVCGMMVEPARAAANGTYGGKTVYFCSIGCKEAYDRSHLPSG
jgi:YHS domain-containing protein